MPWERKILVVDDEPLILSGTSKLLTEAGYSVLSAASGLEAIEAAHKYLPDLILLDVVLPDIDGFEVCQKLKNTPKTSNIFICILSGKRIETSEQATGLESGADDYLTRPIDNRALLARVKAMFRIISAEQKLQRYADRLESVVEERTVELKANEEKYRSLISEMAGGFALHEIICDEDGKPVDYKFLEVNQAFEEMTGLKATDILGKRILEIIPDTEKHWIDTYGQVALTGEPTKFEEYSKEIGEYFDVISFCPQKGNFATIFTNVTKRKQAEIHRNSAIQFKEGVISNSPVGIAIYDTESGECISANQSIADLVGATKEQILSQNYKEIESWKKSGLLAAAQTAIKNDEIIRHPADVVTTFGKTMNIDCHFVTFKSENHCFLMLTAADITRRVKAENDLTKSRQKLKNLISNIPGMTYSADAHWKTDFFSGCMELSGYTPDEINSKHDGWLSIVAPSDRGRVIEESKALFESTATIVCNYRIVTKEGDLRWVEDRKTSIFSENLQFIGIDGVLFDITDRKKNELELRQKHKMEAIGNLAGGIAHDFNNILSSIIGYTDLALAELPSDSSITQDLNEVHIAGIRAKKLVRQILTFARQMEEPTKQIQIDLIAKDALQLIRSLIPSTIEIQEEILSNSYIVGNTTEMNQVFMNLCTNASQAMKKSGGILSIKIMDVMLTTGDKHFTDRMGEGSYVQIQIEDTGVGIPEKTIDQIFDPYFTTKGLGEGTGMGLAVVQSIVEKGGGSIFVESAMNRGTTFWIYLPIVYQRAASTDSFTDDLPAGGESILFIDDEESIAKLGCRILENLGYTVTSSTNSLDALKLFQEKPEEFDLVISDTTMPGMAGDILTQEMIKIRPDIPIILCSGYSHKISDESFAHLGAREFIYKPITKEELATTVRKILDDKKRH